MSVNKVYFLIAGAQKSGTTALAHYLRQHEKLFFTKQVEGHFFDNDSNFDNEEMDYAKYHSYFGHIPDDKYAGEKTPAYMYRPACMPRIYDYNPQMKFLIILRNPIERCYAQWNMIFKRGQESLAFSAAIRWKSDRFFYAKDKSRKLYDYLARGHYAEQIKHCLTFFPKKQFHFMKTECLLHELEYTLNEVCDFLEIARFDVMPAEEMINSRTYPDMSSEDYEFLLDVYKPGIHDLEKLLDWDCSDWLNV